MDASRSPATTTETGLAIRCELDPAGQKVSDNSRAAVCLERHEFQGEWNYTIRPQRTARLGAIP